MQNVQATSSSVGFSAGNRVVWRWTSYSYNTDLTVNSTTIRYKLMNVTGIMDGVIFLEVIETKTIINKIDVQARVKKADLKSFCPATENGHLSNFSF
nr:hypothetical protein [Candidatus Sigynarchaeum springense]